MSNKVLFNNIEEMKKYLKENFEIGQEVKIFNQNGYLLLGVVQEDYTLQVKISDNFGVELLNTNSIISNCREMEKMEERLTSLETDIQYELDNLDFSNEEDVYNSYHYMMSLIETNNEIDSEEEEALKYAIMSYEDYQKCLEEVLITIEAIRLKD